MRIGIISDIHGNLPALVRVMSRLKEVSADEKIWCLGDQVGYGPYPNEVVDLVREKNAITLPGNHEWGMLGRAELVVFNDDARFVVEWTQKHITKENYAFLEDLPEMIKGEDLPFTLVHASPRDHIWEYLLDPSDANSCFHYFDSKYCVVGHTHIPLVFRERPGELQAEMKVMEHGEVLQLGDERLIFNPGSVGQPRDRDRRAHFAYYDTEANTITFERIEYPIELTQARMKDLDFPPFLIKRLEAGM